MIRLPRSEVVRDNVGGGTWQVRGNGQLMSSIQTVNITGIYMCMLVLDQMT